MKLILSLLLITLSVSAHAENELEGTWVLKDERKEIGFDFLTKTLRGKYLVFTKETIREFVGLGESHNHGPRAADYKILSETEISTSLSVPSSTWNFLPTHYSFKDNGMVLTLCNHDRSSCSEYHRSLKTFKSGVYKLPKVCLKWEVKFQDKTYNGVEDDVTKFISNQYVGTEFKQYELARFHPTSEIGTYLNVTMLTALIHPDSTRMNSYAFIPRASFSYRRGNSNLVKWAEMPGAARVIFPMIGSTELQRLDTVEDPNETILVKFQLIQD